MPFFIKPYIQESFNDSNSESLSGHNWYWWQNMRHKIDGRLMTRLTATYPV